MSWKIAVPKPSARRWSFQARLTAWYALCACALVLVVMAVLYSGLTRALRAQTDQFLLDKAEVVRGLLKRNIASDAELREEVEEEWAPKQFAQVYVRIMDPGGRVVTQSPFMQARLPAELFPPPSSKADVIGANGRPSRVLTARAPLGADKTKVFTVQVAIDTNPQQHIAAAYARRVWGLAGAAIVASVLLSIYVTRRGLRPIRQVAGAIHSIHSNSLHERIDPSDLPAELQTLARSFNQMLDRMEEAFTRLSRFSADIAHELRTPVQNLRGMIDVSLGKPRCLEEYRETLGSCSEECARLTRIIDSLLFLARTENPQALIQREWLDLGREFELIREFYDAPAVEAGVMLEVDCPPGLEANVDRILLQRAVGNLIVNAIAYTPRGGRVTLKARGDSDAIRIQVIDTGCGIPEVHLPHVFDRLYRVDHSRSSSSGGMGLGLAIVKSIIALHGGEASIASAAGQGTCVTLAIPARRWHGSTELAGA